MWQLFTLGSLVFNSAEQAADKVIMVADRKLDTVVTSFYRNLVFLVISVLLGLTGLAGSLYFRFEWPLLVVALLEIINSVIYTIILKRIEITGAEAIGYVTPFLFLLTDVFIIKAALSFNQVIGILLLICGGILFVVDPLTHRMKSLYTKPLIGILLLKALVSGAEYYVFKYYATARSFNEISYMVNLWFWVTVGLVVGIVISNKWRLLYRTATHKHYLRKITVSKSFDVGSSVFWFHALSLATVSQVNSFGAFEPLIILVAMYLTQQIFKFKAGEDFTRKGLFQKIIATGILIVGAWLAT